MPTGYHVTLPCHHSETGYRTYDSAFAVDTSEGDTIGLVKMVYQHHTLRKAEEADSEYGAAGFCRQGVYGMPREYVNTMRACTRDAKDAQYDASVPVKPRYGEGESASFTASFDATLHCASTPHDVPWIQVPGSAPEAGSAGLVPLWDGVYQGQTKYPSDNILSSGRLRNLRAGVAGDGSGCHQGTLLSCEASSDCVGTGAEGAAGLECVRGVCVLGRAATSTCYSHSDCSAEGKMCTGDGYCAPPLYQVENNFGESIEFNSYATSCEESQDSSQRTADGQEPPEPYDMFGASPWEQVPDILQMHGMCGYRHWFEYQQFIATSGPDKMPSNIWSLCKNTSAGECRSVDYNGNTAMWWDSTLREESQGFPSLWQSGRFRVAAHACDRDYMHLKGTKGCAPSVTVSPNARTGFVSLDPALVWPRSAPVANPRGRIMQTFNKGRHIPIIRTEPPPGFSNDEWARGGFLYKKSLDGDDRGTPFVACRSVKQCKKDGFQVAGEVVKRKTRVSAGAEPVEWKQEWSTKCGMFGVQQGEGTTGPCRLDLVSMPLYWALCERKDPATNQLVPHYNATAFQQTKAACSKVSSSYGAKCASIRNNYVAGVSSNVLESVRQAVNGLADAFAGVPADKNDYLDRVACSEAIHQAIQQDPLQQAALHGQERVWSFHYFMKHTTVEVPFAMWHKCVLMDGQTLTTSTGGGSASPNLVCDGWQNPIKSNQINVTDYSVDPLGKLVKTDGFISRRQSGLIRGLLAQLVEATVNDYIESLNTEESMFEHSGMRQTAGMACHSSATFKPRSEADKSMPNSCWGDLIRWAQRGGRPRDIIPYNSWGNVPQGVSPDCYQFLGPYQGTSRDLHPAYGKYLRSIDGYEEGPRPFDLIRSVLTRSRVENPELQYVREVDFIGTTIEKSKSGVGHGLVLWEFNPPELPEMLSGARMDVQDMVDGARITKMSNNRMSMASEIPCITVDEVRDQFPCDEKAINQQMRVINETTCRQRHESLLLQIDEAESNVMNSEKLLNGELRTGTQQKQFDFGLQDIIPIVLIVEASIHLADGGAKTTRVPVGEGAETTLWPKELKKMMKEALQNTTDYCIMQARSSTTKLCQSDRQVELQGRIVQSMGGYYSSFKSELLYSEFEPGTVRKQQSAQDVMNSPAAAEAGVRPEGTGSIAVTGVDKAAQPKRAVAESLSQAVGAQEARNIMDQRENTIDESLRKTEALLASITMANWYDCSHILGDMVCIDSPRVMLHAGNFNDDIRSATPNPLIEDTNGGVDDINTACLWLGVPTGSFNCRWHMHDGISEETQRIRRLSWIEEIPADDDYEQQVGLNNIEECRQGHRFTHPISKMPLEWGLNCNLIATKGGQARYAVDGVVYNVTGNTEAVVYTAYTRMISELMHPEPDDHVSAKRRYRYSDALDRLAPRAFPLPSQIFDLPPNGKLSPEAMPELKLGQKQAMDNSIGEFQDCVGGIDTESYETCSDTLLGLYNTASQDVDKYMRRDGPVIVQHETALVWEGLHASHFLSPSIPAWSAADRGQDQHVFARWLFDKAQRCKEGTALRAVCLRDSNPLRSVNPWLGGAWNPYVGCDTSLSGGEAEPETNRAEVYDTYCYEGVCPGKSTDVPFYLNMPDPGGSLGSCMSKRDGHDLATVKGVPRSAAENLCYKSPLQTQECHHPQGMLTGLNGSAAKDLYNAGLDMVLSLRSQSLAHAGAGLFYRGGNPVYYTSKGSQEDVAAQVHAALNVHEEDLAGHHLVLSIGPEGSMVVDRMPLGRTDVPPSVPGQSFSWPEVAVQNSRKSADTHGKEGWLSNLERSMDLDTVEINALYPLVDGGRVAGAAGGDSAQAAAAAWSCPLQRIAFWNRIEDARVFDPIVPNPVRTGRMFARQPWDMTRGSRAHPTMKSRYLDDLAQIHTSNGFCFCQDPAACQIPKGEWGASSGRRGVCGLTSTIDSVAGGAEKEAVSLDGASCGQQLDWPFVHGELRDGMQASSRHAPRLAGEGLCNTLDRLPQFRHSYRSVGVQPNPSGATTMDDGGACHTGAAAQRPAATVTVQTCRATARNGTHVTAKCKGAAGGWVEIVMERKKSVAPTEMAKTLRSRRRWCRGSPSAAAAGPAGTCTAPPEFYDDLGINKLPWGSEVSYGIPFRWSSSRFLAADVRRTACGGDHNNSDECNALISQPEWGTQRFLDNLFDSPERLFSPQGMHQSQPTVAEAIDDSNSSSRAEEDLLWDGGNASWVLCDQSNGECSGSIPRSTWLADGRFHERMSTCTSAIRTAEIERRSKGSIPTAVHLNICDLNYQMDALCRSLQAARQKVIDANCQMTGACSPTEFVYTPGLYSTSNQDFSMGTVQTFYELFNPKLTSFSFDPATKLENRVCPLTGIERDMLVKNAAFTTNCASRKMEVLQDLIRIGRLVVNLLAQTTYVFLNMFLGLMRLIVDTNNREAAVVELKWWADQLGIMWSKASNEIANLIFEMVFGSGLGQMLRTVIDAICGVVNQVLTFINWIKKWLSDFIANILREVNNLLSKIAGRIPMIERAIEDVKKWGKPNAPLTCALGQDDLDKDIIGAVNPVPSRCYVDYIATIDDSNSLSCSKADSCRREDLLFGSAAADVEKATEPVSCASCSAKMVSGAVVQYGCDTLTKQCTCGARASQRTSCTANYQCFLSEAHCGLVMDPSTGKTSGGMPCKQCVSSTPVCLVAGGNSEVGNCACMLRHYPPSACQAGDAPLDRVMPSNGGVCAASLDPGVSKGSTGHLDWGSLVVAPCALIGFGNTFCYNVEDHGLLAVGLGVVDTGAFGRRRRNLLSTNESIADQAQTSRGDLAAVAEEVASFQGWDQTEEPCRSLARQALSGAELGSSSGGSAVLDRLALKSCLHWRRTAAALIKSNSLAALENHDYLLLGPSDFSRAVMHKGVLAALASSPQFWWGAALAHPWAAPFRSLAHRGYLHVHSLLAEGGYHHRHTNKNGTSDTTNNATKWLGNRTLGWLAEALSAMSGDQPQQALPNRTNLETWIKEAEGFARSQQSVIDELGAMSGAMLMERTLIPGAGQGSETKKGGGDDRRHRRTGAGGMTPREVRSQPLARRKAAPDGAGTGPAAAAAPRRGGGGRSLLQAATPGSLSTQYSSLVAAMQAAGNIIPIGGPLGDIWVQGPIGWPPRFEYWKSDKDCAAASVILDLASDTIATTIKAYSKGFGPGRFPPPSARWALQFPKLYGGTSNHSNSTGAWASSRGSAVSFLDQTFEWFGDNVLQGLFSLTPSNIAAFAGTNRKGGAVPEGMWTLGSVLREFLVCDLEATSLCTKHKTSLGVSIAITVAIFSILAAVLSAFGLGGVSTLVWAGSPFLVLYLSYGYAPGCVPQIPVCLLTDMVQALTSLLPLPIRWPNSLQAYPGCLEGAKSYQFPAIRNGTSDCFLRCNAQPFPFDGAWEPTLAWIACGLVDNCQDVRLPFNSSRFVEEVRGISAVLNSGNSDLVSAHTYCFVATLAKSLPWLLLLLLLASCILSLVKLPFLLVSTITQVAVQGVSYTHADP